MDTELVVKVAASGAGRAAKDVLALQEALEKIGKGTQDTAKFAKQLGEALNLPSDDVEALAEALKQAQEETEKLADKAAAIPGAYRDANGRLRDANGKFIKEAKDGFEGLGTAAGGAAGQTGFLGSAIQGLAAGAAFAAINALVAAVQALGQAFFGTIAQANEQALAFKEAEAAAGTLTEDTGALISALDGVAANLQGQADKIELLKSSYDVLSSGFSEAGQAAAILEAANKGAVGGFSDVNTVADALTSTLNSYGLKADQAASFTDKFIATQNAGKLTVAQYAAQIGDLAPIAAQAGVSIDELNGFIATATVKGVQVGSAFAGLAQAYQAVLDPSVEAKKLAKEIGIQFDAQALKTKGLTGILEELNAKGKDTPEVLTVLLGSIDALQAVAPSTGDGLKDLAKNIDLSKNSAGEADKAFKKVAESLPGLQKALKNQIGNAVTDFGLAISPIFAGVLGFIQNVVNAAGEASNGFDPLIEAGTRLQEVLKANPELAQKIGEAFANVADTAIDQIAQIIDAITAFLSEQDNIDQIAKSFQDAGETIAIALERVGTTVRFLIALGEGLVMLKAKAEALPVVGQQIEMFSSFPAKIKAVSDAIYNLGEFFRGLKGIVIEVMQATVDAVGVAAPALQPLLNQVENILNALGQEPEPKAFNSVGAAANTSAKAIKGATDQITNLQKTLVKTPAKSALPGVDPNAAIKAAESLGKLTEANKKSLDKIQLDTANAKANLLEKGGTQAQVAALEEEGLRKRVTTNQKYLADLKALQTKGGLKPEDAKKLAAEISQIEQQLANDRVTAAQATADKKKKAEEEAKKATEKALQASEDAIKQSQTLRERSILELEQKLRKSGASEVAIAEQVAEAKFKAEQQSIQDQIKLQQQKASATGVTAEEKRAAELEIAQLQNDLIKGQIDREKELRDQVRTRIEEAAKLEQQKAEIVAEGLKQVEDSLARQNDLLKAQSQLSEAVAQVRQGIFSREEEQLKRALEIQKQLKEGGLDSKERKALQNELADLGFKKQSKAIETERQLLALQQQRNAQALASLNQQQALERASLEIETARNQAAAQRAVIEQQLAKLKTEAELTQAQADGDQEQIAYLQQKLALENEALQIAQQQQQQEAVSSDQQKKLLLLQQADQRGSLLSDQAQAAQELAGGFAESDSKLAKTAERYADSLTRQSEQADTVTLAFASQLDASISLVDVTQQRLELEQKITDTINRRNPQGIAESAIAGARANGGPVAAGQTYLVGERGPELITPRYSGYVNTAAQTAAMLKGVTMGRLAAPTSAPSNADVVAKLDAVLKAIQSRPAIQAPLQIAIADGGDAEFRAIALSQEHMRGLMRGLGL